MKLSSLISISLYILSGFQSQVGEIVWRTAPATFRWAGLVTGLPIHASASMDIPGTFAKQVSLFKVWYLRILFSKIWFKKEVYLKKRKKKEGRGDTEGVITHVCSSNDIIDKRVRAKILIQNNSFFHITYAHS